MGKGNSAPTPPDPYETASAEAQFNRIDTHSPSGSGVVHGYTDPTTGQFVRGMAPQGVQSAQSRVESPWEQQIRQMWEPASVGLGQRLINDNITGMPAAPRVGDRGNIGQQIFDRSFSMMAPGIEKANERLLTNLQARGVPLGGEAFNDAYGEQLRTTQDAIGRLAMDADIASGQEQSRQFALDSSARQGAMSEIVAAMGGGYNPPSSEPSGAAAGVNYGGMVGQQYQQQMSQFQQQQQQSMQAMGTIGSLGAAAIMKCTKDAKAVEGNLNAAFAARAVASMPLMVWRYLEEHAPEGDGMAQHVGPMAEHFHALTGLGNSKTINVIDIVGILTGALQSALNRIEVLEHRAAGGRVQ